jgi:hypothetical protein
MDVGEVAAPAARDANLLADSVRVFQYYDPTPAPARFGRAKHPGRAASDYYDIIFAHACHILTSAPSYFQIGQHRKGIERIS